MIDPSGKRGREHFTVFYRPTTPEELRAYYAQREASKEARRLKHLEIVKKGRIAKKNKIIQSNV